MLVYYCLKCRKNAKIENLKVAKTKNRRIMLLSKCALCDSIKLKFIKKQEASELLCSVGIKTPLSKIPLVGRFCFNSIKQVNTRYKMS